MPVTMPVMSLKIPAIRASSETGPCQGRPALASRGILLPPRWLFMASGIVGFHGRKGPTMQYGVVTPRNSPQH